MQSGPDNGVFPPVGGNFITLAQLPENWVIVSFCHRHEASAANGVAHLQQHADAGQHNVPCYSVECIWWRNRVYLLCDRWAGGSVIT